MAVMLMHTPLLFAVLLAANDAQHCIAALLCVLHWTSLSFPLLMLLVHAKRTGNGAAEPKH